MKFKDFQRAAEDAYEEIPEAYKEGIDGLVVSREALPHPSLPDIFTLGECATEEYASDWGGPDTTRSQVVLYWGSFRSLAARDPDFDWDGELWETLTHELRHHLESLAGRDELEGVDYALDETFKRDEGLDFDPWYWQHGDDLGDGVFRVEGTVYVEQPWTPSGFAAVDALEVSWQGARFRVPKPDELGDIHFVRVEGIVSEKESLELVLVRKRTWWEDAKRLVGAYRPVVLESEGTAERVRGEG